MHVLKVQILVLLSTFGKQCSVIARSVSQRTSSKGDTSCLINGESHPFNSSFVTCTGNHAMHCYCTMGGMASCMDLCPRVAADNCPPGTTLQVEEKPVESGGNRCSCKRQYCVPAKVFCIRPGNGKKYKVGETFILGNCSQSCRCDENGQISCSPVCSKIKCPKGMRPRGKGRIGLGNGCSCQIQDCAPVPKKFCRVDGRRFRPGRVFITKDCKRKCRCRKNGVPRCSPLCKKPKRITECGLNERLQEVRHLFAGGRCSCAKQVCLPHGRDSWTETTVNNLGRKT